MGNEHWDMDMIFLMTSRQWNTWFQKIIVFGEEEDFLLWKFLRKIYNILHYSM